MRMEAEAGEGEGVRREAVMAGVGRRDGIGEGLRRVEAEVGEGEGVRREAVRCLERFGVGWGLASRVLMSACERGSKDLPIRGRGTEMMVF